MNSQFKITIVPKTTYDTCLKSFSMASKTRSKLTSGVGWNKTFDFSAPIGTSSVAPAWGPSSAVGASSVFSVCR
jgi:hypothetical protein